MPPRLVYRQLRTGSLHRLQQRTEPLPACRPDEVTIAMRAIGLNFADLFALFGLYSATPTGTFIPGLEVAGEVQAIGAGVNTLKPGDPVMGVTRFGAWASHLNVDHRYVRPLPSGWSFEAGAAYPVQALTAYYALCSLGNLQSNQTVLIHSAAGGVGLLANRIAKRFDAFTVGTVGHGDKLVVLEEEGYDRGIVRGRDFPRQLAKALEGRPLDLVLECIGGRILKASLHQLAPRGRLVVYGAARYASCGSRPAYWKLLGQYLRRPRLDIEALISENKSVMAFNLIHLYDQTETLSSLWEGLEQLKLPPSRIGEVFPFAELPAAIRGLQSGRTVGKVVVSVNPDSELESGTKIMR